jgi:hypothetical protein
LDENLVAISFVSLLTGIFQLPPVLQLCVRAQVNTEANVDQLESQHLAKENDKDGDEEQKEDHQHDKDDKGNKDAKDDRSDAPNSSGK